MKKLNKLFFALAVSFAILCGGVGLNTLGLFANTNANLSYAATAFSGGSGTFTDPYLISSGDNLSYLAQVINSTTTNSTYKNKYFKLTKDIDLGGKIWTPIGTSSSLPFAGRFDGNGYVIKNLTIDPTITVDYLGLFGYVGGTADGEGNSTIVDFVLENVSILSSTICKSESSKYVGAVAGYIKKANAISNIFVKSGKIEGCDNVGGIVGATDTNVEIYSCKNQADVFGGNSDKNNAVKLGGIVGSNGGVITACINESSVTKSDACTSSNVETNYICIGGTVKLSYYLESKVVNGGVTYGYRYIKDSSTDSTSGSMSGGGHNLRTFFGQDDFDRFYIDNGKNNGYEEGTSYPYLPQLKGVGNYFSMIKDLTDDYFEVTTPIKTSGYFITTGTYLNKNYNALGSNTYSTAQKYTYSFKLKNNVKGGKYYNKTIRYYGKQNIYGYYTTMKLENTNDETYTNKTFYASIDFTGKSQGYIIYGFETTQMETAYKVKAYLFADNNTATPIPSGVTLSFLKLRNLLYKTPYSLDGGKTVVTSEVDLDLQNVNIDNLILYIKPTGYGSNPNGDYSFKSSVTLQAQTTDKRYHSLHVSDNNHTTLNSDGSINLTNTTLLRPESPKSNSFLFPDPGGSIVFEEKGNKAGMQTLNFIFSDLFEVQIDRNEQNRYKYATKGTFGTETKYVSYTTLKTYPKNSVSIVTTKDEDIADKKTFLSTISASGNEYIDDAPSIAGYTPVLRVADATVYKQVAELDTEINKFKVTKKATADYQKTLRDEFETNANADTSTNRLCPNITQLKYFWNANQNKVTIRSVVYTGSGNFYASTNDFVNEELYVPYSCGKTQIKAVNVLGNQIDSYVGYNDQTGTPSNDVWFYTKTGTFFDYASCTNIKLTTTGDTMILPGFEMLGYVVLGANQKVNNAGNATFKDVGKTFGTDAGDNWYVTQQSLVDANDGQATINHVHNDIVVYIVFKTTEMQVDFISYDGNTEEHESLPGKDFTIPYVILPFAKTVEDCKKAISTLFSNIEPNDFPQQESSQTFGGGITIKYGKVSSKDAKSVKLKGGETLVLLYTKSGINVTNVEQNYGFLIDNSTQLPQLKNYYYNQELNECFYDIQNKPFTENAQGEFYDQSEYGFSGYAFENLFWNLHNYKKHNSVDINGNAISNLTSFPIGLFTTVNVIDFELDMIDDYTQTPIEGVKIYSGADSVVFAKPQPAYQVSQSQNVSTELKNSKTHYLAKNGTSKLCFYITNQSFFKLDNIRIKDKNGNTISSQNYTCQVSTTTENGNYKLKVEISGLKNFANGEYKIVFGFMPTTFDLTMIQKGYEGATTLTLTNQTLTTSYNSNQKEIENLSFFEYNQSSNRYELSKYNYFATAAEHFEVSNVRLWLENQNSYKMGEKDIFSESYFTSIPSVVHTNEKTRFGVYLTQSLISEWFSNSLDNFVLTNDGRIVNPKITIQTTFEESWDNTMDVCIYTQNSDGSYSLNKSGNNAFTQRITGLPYQPTSYHFIISANSDCSSNWVLSVTDSNGVTKTFEINTPITDKSLGANLKFDVQKSKDENNGNDFSQTIEGLEIPSNVNLYFSRTTYTVKYMSQNENGTYTLDTDLTQTGYYGQTLYVAESPSVISHSVLQFLTWNTTQNGTGEQYDPNSSIVLSKDTILYAQYKSKQSLLTLSAEGKQSDGTTNALFASDYASPNWTNTSGYTTFTNQKYATLTVVYGQKYPSNIITPIKKSYKFLGWWTVPQQDMKSTPSSITGNKQIVQNGTVDISQDTTVYAWWSPLRIEVKIDKVLSFAPNCTTSLTYDSNQMFGDNSQFESAWSALDKGITFGNTRYFDFGGFYRTPEYTGSQVEFGDMLYDPENEETPSQITLYAKWNFVGFEFIKTSNTLVNSVIYNGTNQTTLEFVTGSPSSAKQVGINAFSKIESVLDNISGQKYQISWSRVKNGSIDTSFAKQTTSQLLLLNVVDSGTYRLSIKLKYAGIEKEKYIDGNVKILPASATIKFDNAKIYDGTEAIKNVSIVSGSQQTSGNVVVSSAVFVDENLNHTANVKDAKYAKFNLSLANGEHYIQNYSFTLKTATKDVYLGTLSSLSFDTKETINCKITPFDININIGNKYGQINGSKHYISITRDSEYLDANTKKLLTDVGYILQGSDSSLGAVVLTSGFEIGTYYPQSSKNFVDKELLTDIKFLKDGVDLSSNFELNIDPDNSYEIQDVVGENRNFVFDKTKNLHLKDQNGNNVDFSNFGNLYDIKFEYCDKSQSQAKTLSEGWNYFSGSYLDEGEIRKQVSIAVCMTTTNEKVIISFITQNIQDLKDHATLKATFMSSQVDVGGEQTWLWLDNWKASGDNRYDFGNETVNFNTEYTFNLLQLFEKNNNAELAVYPEVKNFAILTLDKNLKNATGQGQKQIYVLRKKTSQTIDLLANDSEIDTEDGLALVGYTLGTNKYDTYTINDSTANIKDFTMYANWDFDFGGINAYFYTDGEKLFDNLQKIYDGRISTLVFQILSDTGAVQNQNQNVITYTWTYNSNESINSFDGKTFDFKDVVTKTITAQLKMSFEYKTGVVVSTQSGTLTKTVQITPYTLDITRNGIDKVYDGDRVVKDQNGNNYILFDISLAGGVETLKLSALYKSAKAGMYTEFTNINLSDYQDYKKGNFQLNSTNLSGTISQKTVETINFGEQTKQYDGSKFVCSGEFENGGLLSGHKIRYTITSKSANIGEYSIENNGVIVEWDVLNSAGQVVTDAKQNYDVTFVGSLTITKPQTNFDGYYLTSQDVTFDNDYHPYFVTKEGVDFDGHALPTGIDVLYTWHNNDTATTGYYTHNAVLGLNGYNFPLANQQLPIFAGSYDLSAKFVSNGNVQLPSEQECEILATFAINRQKVTVNLGDLIFENVAKYTLNIDTSRTDIYTFEKDTNMTVDGKRLVLPTSYDISSTPINFDTNKVSIVGLLNGFVLKDTISNQRFVQGRKFTIGSELLSNPSVLYGNSDYSQNFEVSYNLSFAINHTYTINFDSNGGSNASGKTVRFGDGKISLPTVSKSGYTFDGWEFDASQSDQSTLNPALQIYSAGMTELENIAKHGQTITFKAKFSPATTKANIEFYTQNLTSGYTRSQLTEISVATESKLKIEIAQDKTSLKVLQNGINIRTITLQNQNLAGFTLEDNNQSQVLEISSANGNGENTFKVYLSRNTYTLTLQYNNTNPSTVLTYLYEQSVSRPADPTLFGYVFDKWIYTQDSVNAELAGKEETFANLKMPSHDLIVFANYQAKEDTKFAVLVYFENLDGTFDTYKEGQSNPNIEYHDFSSLTDSFANLTISTDYKSLLLDVYEDKDLQTKYDKFSTRTISIKDGYTLLGGQGKNILTGQITSDFTVLKVYVFRQTYRINYVKNNGQADEYKELLFGELIEQPNFENFEKNGYSFDGWYSDQDFQTKFNFEQNHTMPANDFVLYAKWNSNEVGFVLVKNIQNILDDNYSPQRSAIYAKTSDIIYVSEENGIHYLIVEGDGTQRTKMVIDAQGFLLVGWSNQTIVSGTQETTFELKYDRNKYKLTVNYANGQADFEKQVKYQTTLSDAGFDIEPQKAGYKFEGYYLESNFVTKVDLSTQMPNKELKLFANYTNSNTTFDLVLSTENLQGTFDESVTSKNATSNDTIKIVQDGTKRFLCILTNQNQKEKISLEKTGFSISKIFVDNVQVLDFDNKDIAIVKGDGTTNIKVEYSRNSYTLTKDFGYDNQKDVQTKKFGEQIDLTAPQRAGYRFVQWYNETPDKKFTNETMPAQDLTLYAVWEADSAQFEIRYNFQDLNDETLYTYESSYTEKVTSITGYTLVLVDGKLQIKNGYTLVQTRMLQSFAGFVLATTTIEQSVAGDNSTVVNLNFDRNKYDFTLVLSNGEENQTTKYKFDQPLDKPTDPTKVGYTFDGWYSEDTFANKFEFENATMPAGDLTLWAKWSVAKVKYTFVLKEQNLDGTYTDKTSEYFAFTQNQIKVETDTDGKSFKISEYNGETFVKTDFEKVFDNGFTLKDTLPITVTVLADGSTSITLTFDRNEYNLVYKFENGESDQTSTLKYGAPLTKPADPTKVGYRFVGWYTDSATTQVFDFANATMPAYDLALWAKYVAADGITFTVQYFKMDAQGNYPTDASEQDVFEGTTGNTVEITNGKIVASGQSPIDLRTFEHFVQKDNANQVLSGVILADGSLTLKVYFERKQYTVTIVYSNGQADKTITQYFQTTITEPNTTKTGYVFDGWYTENTFANKVTMPYEVTKDASIFAKWKESTVSFTLDILTQNIQNDDYTTLIKTFEATTNNKIVGELQNSNLVLCEYNGETKIREIFTLEISDGFNLLSHSQSINVLADSSAKYIVTLDRNTFELTFVTSNGEENKIASYKFEQPIEKPTDPTKAGYTFDGWYREDTFATIFNFANATMPAQNLTLYAKYVANDNTKYKVEYYLQELDGSYKNTASKTEEFVATTDFDVQIQSLQILVKNGSTVVKTQDLQSFQGFDFDQTNLQNVLSGKVSGQDTLVLKVYFARNTYTLTLVHNDFNNTQNTQKQYKFGQTISKIDPVENKGFAFDGWYTEITFENMFDFTNATMPSHDFTLWAKWTKANTTFELECLYQTLQNSYDQVSKTITAQSLSAIKIQNQDGQYVLNVLEDGEKTQSYNLGKVGFDFDLTQNTTFDFVVSPDGTTKVQLYFARQSFDLTYKYILGDQTITMLFEQPIQKPQDDQKDGYIFDGWYNGEQKFDFTNATMPNNDLVLTPKFVANTNTRFVLQYFLENLDGTYSKQKEQTLQGQTDYVAKVEDGKIKIFDQNVVQNQYDLLTFAGFEQTSNPSQVLQVTILGDNSAAIKVYFARKEFTITFVYNDNVTVDKSFTQKYQTTVDLALPTRQGYTFVGWFEDEIFKTMATYTQDETNATFEITKDLTLWAKWQARGDIKYVTNYWLQNADDDTFTLFESDELFGTVDTTVDAITKVYTGFTFDQTNINNITSGVVKADGSLVLNLYYIRNIYSITYHSNGGEGSMNAQSFKYGQTLALLTNTFTRSGFAFVGWTASANDTTVQFTQNQDFTFNDTQNVDLYAIWQINQDDLQVQISSDFQSREFGDKITISTNASYTADVELVFEWYFENNILAVDANSLTIENISQSGSYYVVVTAKAKNTIGAKDYVVTAKSNTIQVEITQRILVVEFEDTSFVYNGTVQIPSFVAKIKNASENQITIPTLQTYVSSQGQIAASKNVGVYNLKTSVTDTNFVLEGEDNTDFEITPAQIDISSKIKKGMFSKPYATADFALTLDVISETTGETVKVLFERVAGEEIGYYDIFLASPACTNANFEIVDNIPTDNQGFQITKSTEATVKVGFANTDLLQKVYDGHEIDVESVCFNLSNLVFAPTANVTKIVFSIQNNSKNVGEYKILIEAVECSQYENFELDSEYTFKITPKTLSYNNVPVTKVYDKTTDCDLLLTDDILELDRQNVSLVASYQDANANNRIKINVQITGDGQNYRLDSAFENLYGKIDPMQVQVEIQDKTLVYGEFNQDVTFDYQIFGKNGENFDIPVDYSQFDGKLFVQAQAKYKPNKYKILQNTLCCTTGNYVIQSLLDAYLTITPKPVVASANFEKFYDGTNTFDGQIALTGTIDGDDVWASATFATAQAQTDILVSIVLLGADADCYQLQNTTAIGAIVDQSITVKFEYGFDEIICNSHSPLQYTVVDLLYNKTVLEGLNAKGFDSLPTPWAEGWNFEGWFDQKEGGNQILETTMINQAFGMPNTTKTIYARYSYGTLSLVLNMVTFDGQDYNTQKDGGSVQIDGNPYTFGQKKFATFNDTLQIAVTANADFDFVGFFEGQSIDAKQLLQSETIKIDGNILEITMQKNMTIFLKFKTKQFDLILDFDTTDTIATNQPFNSWTKNQNTISKTFDKYSVVTLPVDGEISRRGYTFVGWTRDKNTNTLESQDVSILDTLTLYAIWQAKQFDITLNANTGTEDASLLNADSGQFADGTVQKVIVATYDQTVDTLPVPQRKGYTFQKWVDQDGNVWIENQIYNLVTDKELFATWQANTIIAQIQTIPSLQDITITSLGQKVTSQMFGTSKLWTIEMKVTDTLSFECFDVTGYTLAYTSDKQNGTDLLIDYNFDTNHKFDISRMVGDFTIKILYKSNLHTYKVVLNENWGSLDFDIAEKLEQDMRAEARDDQNIISYDGDKTYTIKIYSSETLSLKIKPNTGYSILSTDFEGANVSGDIFDKLYLSQICTDGMGTVEFEPSTNIVKISVGLDTTTNETDSSMGYLNVFKVNADGETLITTEYQNFAQVGIKTGESIKIQPVARFGYEPLFETSLWQIQKELSSAGDVSITFVDGQTFVTVSNITCNIDILVPFQRLKFALVPKVAILEGNQLTLAPNPQDYVDFDFLTTPVGTKQIDGITYNTYYYLTDVVTSANVTNIAYNPLGWFSDLDPDAKISDAQSLSVTIDQDKQILFVVTIKTYTIEYSALENGRIDGNQSQTIKHGQDAEAVEAIANAGYKFEKWQIFDTTTQNWVDDSIVTTSTRQDMFVTSDKLVRAVFAPSDLNINIQTRFLDGYDANGDPIYLDLTQDIAYIYKIGADEKLFELNFETASNQQTRFALEIAQGYSIANIEIDDDGSTKYDISSLRNITLDGYVTDINVMITIKANENKFDVGFVEYRQDGTISPYYLTAQNRILVSPENCASENGKPRVSVVAKTNKSFSLSAEFLNGYEFVTNSEGKILIGIVFEGQTTVQYLDNVTSQGLNGIYISRISVNVQNVSQNAKIYVFVTYTKYPVTFHISDDTTEDRVFELAVNSDFGEVDRDVIRPSKTGMFFVGWYSQIQGNGLKYVDSNGNVLTNWNIEHTELYAYWETAYVTYNIVYVPGDQAISEQIGLSNTLPTALRDFTSNTQFKYYVDNEVILTAPRANQNYQYAYIQIGEQKYTDNTISFVIPQDTTVFEQTIYIYYKVAVSVTVSGGGQATIDGQITVYLLDGESATLSAEANRGYVFVGWTEQNDQTILSANSSMTVSYSSRPKVYCANFDGRTTELKLVQTEHGLVTKVKVNGVEAVMQNGKYIVKLGDYISFEYTAEAGYYLYGWQINGVANSTFDRYQVTVDDVCRNELTFAPNFVLANISYTIIYDTNSGSVKTNSNTISSGFTLSTDYLQTNIFQIIQNKRFVLDKVTLNGQDIADLVQITTSGGTLALASNRLDMTRRNIIEIQFKKIYWLDSKSMFEGLGTEANPYTIMSPEQFAMMCYLINNNIPVDADNKVNYASGYYVLSSTVDFEDAFWVPIGTEENPFDGTMRFDYGYKNVVLDKYYSVTCYDGLFGYVTDYAKFIKSTQTYKIAVIVVTSFVGLLIIITVVFVITRHLKRKKYQRQSSELLNIPKKPLK